MLHSITKLVSTLALFLIFVSNSFSQGWTVQTVSVGGADLKALFFLNSLTGYCVGQSGTIIKTTNGGTNWVNQTSGTSETLNDVYFLDVSTGYVVGNAPFPSGDGVILKTTNGGTNWVSQSSNSSGNNLYCVHFFSSSRGIAGKEFGGGDTSNFVMTTNGGTNWVKVFAGPAAEIYSMDFPTSSLGYATGSQTTPNNAYIVTTTNSGSNWTYGFSTTTAIQNDVSFGNSSTGYTAGFFGTVAKTTNSGSTWFALTTGQSPSDNYYGTFFTTVSTGYVVGSKSGTSSPIIIKTTNGGSNWTEQPTGQAQYLEDVKFVDDNTGWVCGRVGLLMKTTTGGMVTGITNINSHAEDFDLQQNYPNPFNPETKIKFSIPAGIKSNVKLTVFDVAGRQVEQLVNEQLNTGTYEYSFNGAGLTSGVYFYKLETSEFVETRKMMLVK